jgi:hypothetical protein
MTGIGRFPSCDYKLNHAWLTAAMIAQILLAWLKLIALDGDLARAEPKTLRSVSCMPLPAWCAEDAADAGNSPPPGPGPRQSPGPGSLSAHSPTSAEQHESFPATCRKDPGPVEPPASGPPAGFLSYPDPKFSLRRDLGNTPKGSAIFCGHFPFLRNNRRLRYFNSASRPSGALRLVAP